MGRCINVRMPWSGMDGWMDGYMPSSLWSLWSLLSLCGVCGVGSRVRWLQGAVRENIKVDRLVENPNIIFMEPRRGNHFGFYEGGLLEAFSCERTYSYPPRVALSFFKSIIAHQQQQEQQQELEKEQQEQKKR